MNSPTLGRRGFLKLSATVAACAATASTLKTHHALAETGEESSSSSIERVRSCCRACGKMECGVWVIIENGRIVRIEGDPSAPQSRGNCCAKSQASLQAAYHPDRLRYPLKRTNPKGEDPGWERITWDEAWEIFSTKVAEIQEKYGVESMMCMNGTSRAWGNTGTATKPLLGTPNVMSAGQICKVPRMISNTLTDFFGSYWLANVDEIDDHRVYVQWGTAVEYSNYDDSGRTVNENRKNAQMHILIDPRITPLGKEADIWLPVRPGTDGALAMSWIRTVIDHELCDDLFVKRWTNSSFLVCDDIEPSGYFVEEGPSSSTIATRLLKESDLVEGGSPKRYIVFDNLNGVFTYFDSETCVWEGETYVKPTNGQTVCDGFLPDPSQFNPPKDPALYGEFEVTLKDGRTSKVRPVWEYLVEAVEPYTPEHAAEICGVNADDIERACLAWATRLNPSMPNAGIHFQLATDQCGTPTQTIRALTILQDLVGCPDNPGCGRGPATGDIAMAPLFIYPKREGHTPYTENIIANDKMVGRDKFPLTAWNGSFTDSTLLWEAVLSGNPYPVRGNVAATGNFMCQANSNVAWEALASLDFFFMADLWQVPMAGMADVLVPVAHWLEQNFPRCSQGASGWQGATVKCVDPPGEALPETQMLIDMARALGKPWNLADPTGNPWPTLQEMENEFVKTHNGYTWDQYNDEFQKNGWWDVKKDISPDRWGVYRRYEMGKMHHQQGYGTREIIDELPGFWTPTRLVEIWSTIMETYVGAEHVMPRYTEPYKSPVSTPELAEEYPFIITTGSRNPTYFHSEHRQLPWCRELWPVPRVEIHPEDAEALGIKQGDWVWIESPKGKVRQVADLYYGIRKGVVNANHTWWYPELSAPKKGFDLSNINCLVDEHDQDPYIGATSLRAYLVKVYKATPENCPNGQVVPCDDDGTPVITAPDDPRLKEWLPDYESERGEML